MGNTETWETDKGGAPVEAGKGMPSHLLNDFSY